MRAAVVATLVSLCLGAWAAPPPPVPLAVAGHAHESQCRAVPGPNETATSAAPAADRSGSVRPVATSLSTSHLPIAVDVFAHVLRTAVRGGVPRVRIRAQIAALNGAFAGRQSPVAAWSPFRFRLARVDVTVNRAWYRMNEGSIAERHAKRALHAGTKSDLNLYIGNNSSGALGWGSQPTAYAEEPRMDGVVIARHTMPGGQGGRYSAGDAAVHETGHWLGLLHTFAGKCTKRGDRVADTPAEARPSYDCGRRRDTCAAPGNDPVHNFMDYGDDSCMNQFTPGQVDAMLRSWRALRQAGRA